MDEDEAGIDEWTHYLTELEEQHGRRELWALDPYSVDVNIFFDLDSHMVNKFRGQCPSDKLWLNYEVEQTRILPVSDSSSFGGNQPLSAFLQFVEPIGSNPCGLPNESDVNGKIAVVKRETACSFHDQSLSMQVGGAVAVVILNDGSDDSTLQCNSCDDISIPIIFVKNEDVRTAEFAAKYELELTIECEAGEEGCTLGASYQLGGRTIIETGFSAGSDLVGVEQLVSRREAVRAEPAFACVSLENSADVSGKIAVVTRGGCALSIKAKFAQDAGAVGVLILNNGSPETDVMDCTTDCGVTIPTVFINNEDVGRINLALDYEINMEIKCKSGIAAAGCPEKDLVVFYDLSGSQVVSTIISSVDSPWGSFEHVPATKVKQIGEACTPVSEDVTGKIAVALRGTCGFSTKAKNAQDAGAIGIIILDNSNSPTTSALACAEDCNSISIPVTLVQVNDVHQVNLVSDAGLPIAIGCNSFDPCDAAYAYAKKILFKATYDVYGPVGFNLKSVGKFCRSIQLSPSDTTWSYLNMLQGYDIPEGAHMRQHLTTRDIGGGRAVIGGLYTSKGYAATGITATFSDDPTAMHSDAAIFSHEMGHNFGAFHTHSGVYSEVIDTCFGNEQGQCQWNQGGTFEVSMLQSGETKGTIMSYCDACEGSHSNIRLEFHRLVKEQIYRSFAPHRGLLQYQLNPTADLVVEEGCPENNFGWSGDWVSTGVHNGRPSYKLSTNGNVRLVFMVEEDFSAANVANVEPSWVIDIATSLESLTPHSLFARRADDGTGFPQTGLWSTMCNGDYIERTWTFTDVSDMQKLDGTDCGGSTHTDYDNLFATFNSANNFIYKIAGEWKEWDQTATGCQLLCKMFDRCHASTMSANQCVLITGLRLTQKAPGHVCFVKQVKKCCDRVVVEGLPDGLQEHRTGTFKVTDRIHDGFPIYMNLHGEMMYFESQWKSWRIGSEFESAGVISTSNSISCPSAQSSWKVYNNGWSLAPNAQVSCSCCEVMELSSTNSEFSQLSGEFVRTDSVFREFSVWKNSEKDKYITMASMSGWEYTRWRIGGDDYPNNWQDWYAGLKSIGEESEYAKRDQVSQCPIAFPDWKATENGDVVEGVELTCKIDEHCPATVQLDDDGESCTTVCQSQGFDIGFIALNSFCRCTLTSSTKCPEKPHTTIAGSYNGQLWTCEYEVCVVPGSTPMSDSPTNAPTLNPTQVPTNAPTQNPTEEELPSCIVVSGSPSQQSWCDGVYHLLDATTLSSEGERVYRNVDDGESDRYLYWSPSYGGRWQIDHDYDAQYSRAFFPSPQGELPAGSGRYWLGSWTIISESQIQVHDCEELPSCIVVSGSPSQQSWCDGVYQLLDATTLSSEGERVYRNVDEGEADRFLYYSTTLGGRWIIDKDTDHSSKRAYFPSAQREFPVGAGYYWLGSWTLAPGSQIQVHDCRLSLNGVGCSGFPSGGIYSHVGKFNNANAWQGPNQFVVYVPTSELPNDWNGGRWVVVNADSLSAITEATLPNIMVAQNITPDSDHLPPSGLWQSGCPNQEGESFNWTFSFWSSNRRTLEADAVERNLVARKGRLLVNEESQNDEVLSRRKH